MHGTDTELTPTESALVSDLVPHQFRLEFRRKPFAFNQVPQVPSLVPAERFWLVDEEQDTELMGERSGTIYTAAEARPVVYIADPTVVAEVHRWKREFNATAHS